MTFDRPDEDSYHEEDDDDVCSDGGASQAEGSVKLVQMRSHANNASARVTMINGHEGIRRPDVRQSFMEAAAALSDASCVPTTDRMLL